MRFLRRRARSEEQLERIADGIERQNATSGSILDAVRTLDRPWEFWVATAIGLAGLVVGVVTLATTIDIRDAVAASPQEVVDGLPVGTTAAEFEEVLGVSPAVSQAVRQFPVDMLGSVNYRRYEPTDQPLVVEAYFDSLLQARVIVATVTDPEVRVRFPEESQGALSGDAFVTNATTLAQLSGACPGLETVGYTTPDWVSVEATCPPKGYNDFNPQMVALNMIADGEGPRTDLAVESIGVDGILEDPEVDGLRDLTFNAFALVDKAILSDGGQFDDYQLLTEWLELGPPRNP